MLSDDDDLESQAQRELDIVGQDVDTSGLPTPIELMLRCGHPSEWLLSEAKEANLR